MKPKKNASVFRDFWNHLFTILALLSLAACQTVQTTTPNPTSAQILTKTSTTTATATVTATSAPTATHTPTFTMTPSLTPSPTPDLPIRPFTWKGQTRPLLLAHYMPWYQTPAVSGTWGYHWTMNHFSPTQKADGSWQDLASHNIPLTGPYDSNDPAVLEYQMMLMKLSGIDGVIVDWYGMENFWDYGTINTSTKALFTAVKKAGLKFAICYEDQTILHMLENNHLTKDEAIPHAQKVMAYLQTTWFNDSAYLKVSRRPLLFNFGPQYFKQDADWKTIFENSSPQPLLITLDNITGPGSAASFPWPPMWSSQAGVLSIDSLEGYLDVFYLKSQAWPVHVGGAFPGFHDIYKEAGVGEGYGFLDALDGRTFRLTLQIALDHQPEMIQLITWNDYGEGTVIEPTVEFEYRYLEILQELNGVLSGGKFAFTSEDLRLPFKLYQQRLKTDQDQAMLTRIDQAVQALFSGDLSAARSLNAGNP